MKKHLVFILALLTSAAVFAAVERRSMDIKLPGQVMVEKQVIPTPAVGASGAILSGHAGPTSAAARVVTTGISQPDVPRAISIASGGTTADVAACVITVTGKNILGRSISETFTFTANESATKTGSKAFKSISSVSWPASCEDSPYGATWNVNTTDKLGLKACMDKSGHLLMTTYDGAYENTRATAVADADEVEKNTVDPNGTLDDAKDIEAFFFQNFRCP